MISEFFNQFLYRPLLNVLVLLCLYLPGQDFGLAVIILTVAFKSFLLPLNKKMAKNQKDLMKIQPKIKKIQKDFKDDNEQQLEKIKSLYKEYDVNPLSSFVPLLIQFPILIALYQVFLKGLNPTDLYSFIPNSAGINYSFIGIDLMIPSLTLAILAVIVYFVQIKISLNKTKQVDKKKNDISAGFQKQMPYFFSFLTFFVLIKVPAAVALYLTVSSLFTMTQQYILNKNELK
jgi:YidC/Oxa1 family membrane protein insertase